MEAATREHLLAALMDALQLPQPSASLRRAADAGLYAACNGESGWRQLEASAAELGLRVTDAVGDPAHIGGALHEGRVAMLVSERGQEWFLIDDHRTGSLRVRGFPGDPAPRWVRPDAVPGLLGFAVGSALRWAWLEPCLPAVVLSGDSPIHRISGLVRAERADVLLVLSFGIGVGILSLATPAAVQVLINTVAYGTLRQPLIAIVGVLFVALVFAAVLRAMQQYVVELLQRRLFVRVVGDLSRRLPRVPISTFDAHDGPELVNRFFDVITLQKVTSTLLLDGLSAATQAAVGLVLLALYHPYLLGYDLILIATLAGILYVLGHGASETAVGESRAKYEVVAWLQAVSRHEWLHKLGTGRRIAEQRADRLTSDYLRQRQLHFRIVFRQFGASLALQALGATLMLGGGGWLVLDGQLTLGQLVAAEYIVASVLIAFVKFTDKLDDAYDLFAAADKLGHLIDLPVEADAGTASAVDHPIQVTCQHVDYAYALDTGGHGHGHGHGHGSHATGPLVLSGYDLVLEPGSATALLSDEPSGKTTLADLLLGFREPTHGHVGWSAGGRTLAPADVQHHAALVRDDTMLAGTLFDNVAMSRQEVTTEQVDAALRAVGLGGLPDRLPNGLVTELLADGPPLSESERTKLGFARAIAAQPRLIVVDCALDRLGPRDRDRLVRTLTDPRAGWTLLVLTRDPDVAARLPVRRPFTPRFGAVG